MHNGAPDLSKPVLTIDPIEDHPWNIIAEEGFEDSNYGLKEYEQVITEKDKITPYFSKTDLGPIVIASCDF